MSDTSRTRPVPRCAAIINRNRRCNRRVTDGDFCSYHLRHPGRPTMMSTTPQPVPDPDVSPAGATAAPTAPSTSGATPMNPGLTATVVDIDDYLDDDKEDEDGNGPRRHPIPVSSSANAHNAAADNPNPDTSGRSDSEEHGLTEDMALEEVMEIYESVSDAVGMYTMREALAGADDYNVPPILVAIHEHRYAISREELVLRLAVHLWLTVTLMLVVISGDLDKQEFEDTHARLLQEFARMHDQLRDELGLAPIHQLFLRHIVVDEATTMDALTYAVRREHILLRVALHRWVAQILE